MTIKKIATQAVSMLMATATLAVACGNFAPKVVETEKKSKADLVVVPNTLRLKQDDDLPDYGYGDTVSVSLAKSESEAGQFIIYANRDISSFSVGVTDLVNEDGEVLPTENIAIYAEHYIYVSNTIAIDQTSFKAGYYPDALIPMANYIASGENEIKKGNNQGVYIDVSTTSETSAGEYTGQIIVNTDGDLQRLNFTVEVFDFDITKETHFKSAFNLWSNNMCYIDQQATVHGYSDQKLFAKYYEYMVKHRAMPMDIPSLNLTDFEAYALDLYEYATREDVASYSIPTIAKTITLEGELCSVVNCEKVEELFRALLDASLEKEFDLFEKMYIYIPYHDEPSSARQYEALRITSDGIENVKKKLVAEYEEKGLFASEIGQKTKESILGVPQLITVMNAQIMSDLQGYVDAWCPTTPMYNSAESRIVFQERQEAGDEVWWYTAGNSNPNPNYHIHEHLLATRMLGLMSYNFDVDGNLFWASNLFGAVDITKGTSSAIPRDVWEDPMAFFSGAGNAFLMYPGTKYNIDGPIGTLRLTAIRDGQEDYEYMYQLNSLLERANLDYQMELTAKEYAKELTNRLFTSIRTVIDQEELLRVRKEMANLICALQSEDFGLVVKLNGKDGITQTQSVSIYAKSGVSVSVNGKGLTGVASGSGTVFTTSVPLDERSNSVTVVATKGDKELTVERNIGGRIKNFETFENLENTDNLRTSNLTASVEENTDNVLTGNKSLKLSWTKSEKEVSRYVRFRSQAGYDFADCEKLQSIEFDIYNASATKFAISFNTSAVAEIASLEIPSGEKTHVFVPLARFAPEKLKGMSYFEISFGNADATVYIDNIYTTYRQFDRIEHKVKTSDIILGEETGASAKFDKQGNLLLTSFEEEKDLRRIWFHNLFNSYLERVDKTECVTDGVYALEVIYNGAYQIPGNNEGQPSIRFYNMNNEFTGFFNGGFTITDYKALEFDIVNYGDDITFTVYFYNAKNKTIRKTVTVKSGEKTKISIAIDEKEFNALTESGFGDFYSINIGWEKHTQKTQQAKHFCLDNIKLIKR